MQSSKAAPASAIRRESDKEVAGEAIGKANITEKAKTQKQIIRDCLAGTGGRTKVESWVPGWLCFPSRLLGAAAAREDTHDEVRAAA